MVKRKLKRIKVASTSGASHGASKKRRPTPRARRTPIWRNNNIDIMDPLPKLIEEDLEWWGNFKKVVISNHTSACKVGSLETISIADLGGHGDQESYSNQDINKNNATNLEPMEDELEDTFDKAYDIMISLDLDSKIKVLQEISENQSGIKFILVSLEANAEKPWAFKISKLLRECVYPKIGRHTSELIKHSIDLGYLNIIFRILEQVPKLKCQPSSIHSVASDVLWYLAALAYKDKDFSTKLRHMSRIRFFHDIFARLFFGKSSNQYSLLKILRLISKNASIAETLGRDRVMTTCKRMFAYFNNRPSLKFQMLLESIAYLTRREPNVPRFLKAGLLVRVKACFQRWDAWKGRGLLKLSKCIISIYANISEKSSARKVLRQSDALKTVRRFCEMCPGEKAYDEVLANSLGMIRMCYEKHMLPLDHVRSPIEFQLLNLNLKNYDETGSSSDEEGPGEEEDAGGKDIRDESDKKEVLEEGDNSDSDSSDNNFDEEEIGNRRSSSKVVKNKDTNANNSTSESSYSVSGTDKTFSDSIFDSENVDIQELYAYKRFFKETSMYSPCYDSYNGLDELLNILNASPTTSPSIFSIEKELQDEQFAKANIPNETPRWLTEHPGYRHKHLVRDLRKKYFIMANKINHVSPFVKIAYPDLSMSFSVLKKETILSNLDRGLMRQKMLGNMQHVVTASPEFFKAKVVFSLDDLINKNEGINGRRTAGLLSDHKFIDNNDELNVGKYDKKSSLKFESRFECGNLRKAIQVGAREYDLILTPDINSDKHSQWFYFQVSNVLEDVGYTFNIINFTKTNSQFNYGMQPIAYSVAEALLGRPGWARTGSHLCYFRNGYRYISKSFARRSYYTLSFNVTFLHKGDIVYVAYFVPFTYTRLMVETHSMLETLKSMNYNNLYVSCLTLCKSLNQNDVPLITITGKDSTQYPTQERQVILLTSRVHPGETNASWVMHGILHKLLFGSNMSSLLNRFIFKIIPMLNVEGVINGCHRCGLTSEDLNRTWKSPSKFRHPAIYHTKMCIEYLRKIENKIPALFCDIHGHSRRKNIFFYGCSYARSWWHGDRLTPENPNDIYSLPEALAKRDSTLVLPFCQYDVKKSREKTARVSLWREYKISRSYTLENTYCGCDRGPYKGLSIGTSHLLELGEHFCEALDDALLRSDSSSNRPFRNKAEQEGEKLEFTDI